MNEVMCMIYDVLPLSDYVGKYIKYTPPWQDYHDIRYGRVYAVSENDNAVLAVSWYDAFTGYEEVVIPLRYILQVADKFRGIEVPDNKMPIAYTK